MHEEEYNSRSESIRDALRDAVEHARRTGESETFTRDEIVNDRWRDSDAISNP